MSYVSSITGGSTQAEIGHKAGVSAATVSRWTHSAPKPESVAAFARAYDRPVLEAFIAAGFLTEEDAGVRPATRLDLSKIEIRRLLREVEARYGEMEKALRNAEHPSRESYDLAARAGDPDIAPDQIPQDT